MFIGRAVPAVIARNDPLSYFVGWAAAAPKASINDSCSSGAHRAPYRKSCTDLIGVPSLRAIGFVTLML